MLAPDVVVLFAVLLTGLGILASGGGIVLLVCARAVTVRVVDLLGEWVVSAVRGFGIVLAIVGLVFLAGGIENVVRLLSR